MPGRCSRNGEQGHDIRPTSCQIGRRRRRAGVIQLAVLCWDTVYDLLAPRWVWSSERCFVSSPSTITLFRWNLTEIRVNDGKQKKIVCFGRWIWNSIRLCRSMVERSIATRNRSKLGDKKLCVKNHTHILSVLAWIRSTRNVWLRNSVWWLCLYAGGRAVIGRLNLLLLAQRLNLNVIFILILPIL